MAGESSVTHWIEELKDGDEGTAQQELWNRYFKRLVALAHTKMSGLPQRVEDEEDVVLSAFDSFFQRAQRGDFPLLRDRTNLWPLLVKITARKAINQIKRQQAQKRGAGHVRGESVFAQHPDQQRQDDIGQLVGREPTPDFAIQTSEECQRLLDSLDEGLRLVAERKLQGFTNGEIAKELDVVERTVERKLNLIRQNWLNYLEE